MRSCFFDSNLIPKTPTVLSTVLYLPRSLSETIHISTSTLLSVLALTYGIFAIDTPPSEGDSKSCVTTISTIETETITQTIYRDPTWTNIPIATNYNTVNVQPKVRTKLFYAWERNSDIAKD